MPAKPDLFVVGLVWFARYCGKMYSHHLFSYGGLFNKPFTGTFKIGALINIIVSV